MIKFEKLVEELLVEARLQTAAEIAASNPAPRTRSWSAPSTPAVNQTQTPAKPTSAEETPKPEDVSKEKPKTEDEIIEEVSKNLVTFCTGIYNRELKQKLKEAFPAYYEIKPVLDEAKFHQLVYIVTKNSLRNTENIGSFDEQLSNVFPLIDLIALLKQTETDTPGKRSEKDLALNKIYKEFVDRLKKFGDSKPDSPLKFPALNPWAINVRDRYFAELGKLDLGKLKLESPEVQTKSIRGAVMFLLENRRKEKLKFFTKEISFGNAQRDINTILENPEKYTTGQNPFPDKTLKLLYSGDVSDLLLSVAHSSRNLFNQQCKEKEKEENLELYKNFLDNNISKLFSVQTKSEETPAKEETIGDLGRAMLGFESFQTKMQAILEELNQKENTFVTGTYTVKDISANTSLPEANQLYKALKTLADYLQTEAESGWSVVLKKAATVLSKGAEAAQGLLFGVKIPGM